MIAFLAFALLGIVCVGILRGFMIALFLLLILAVGAAIFIGVLLLVMGITSSPVLAWIAALLTAVWECRVGYRMVAEVNE